MTNGNSVAATATNGLTVNAAVAGTTATVNFTGAALSVAALQTLVGAMSYRNTSQAPTDANRVVTITQLVDSGSNTAPSDNTAALSIASTVNVNPVNDAPVVGVGTLAAVAAVAEDTANPPGATVAALFGAGFTDPDGDLFAGIAVAANTAATQGAWQYSTDGTSWFAVGAASDAAALALGAAARLRFVPAADFNGSPPGLAVYGLDATHAGGFTAGGARIAINASLNGGITPISDTTTTLDTSISEVNDAPAAVNDALSGVVEDTVRTIAFAELTGNDSRGPANESGQLLTVGSATAAWHIVGTGDLNGNGTDDIIWQNDNGQVAGWLLNGGVLTTGQDLGTTPPTTHIVGSHFDIV